MPAQDARGNSIGSTQTSHRPWPLEKSRDQYGIDEANWSTITTDSNEEQVDSQGYLPLDGRAF